MPECWGVVSEADLRAKLAETRQGRRPGRKPLLTPGGMMPPAVSVANAPLAAAARKMQARKVRRVLTTDDSGHFSAW
jgi:CBS domain-containing protein